MEVPLEENRKQNRNGMPWAHNVEEVTERTTSETPKHQVSGASRWRRDNDGKQKETTRMYKMSIKKEW